MKPGRGRRITLWNAVGALAVLAAAGFAFRARLLEEYWLWRPGRRLDYKEEGRSPVGRDALGTGDAIPHQIGLPQALGGW